MLNHCFPLSVRGRLTNQVRVVGVGSDCKPVFAGSHGLLTRGTTPIAYTASAQASPMIHHASFWILLGLAFKATTSFPRCITLQHGRFRVWRTVFGVAHCSPASPPGHLPDPLSASLLLGA